MQKIEDSELLTWLKASNYEDREKAFEYIYQNYYEGIKTYVLQNNGSTEDVRDLFQDAIVVLYNQVLRGAFKEQSTIKTYLYGICRNIWYKKLSKKKGTLEIETIKETSLDNEVVDQILIGNEREQLIRQLINQLSAECIQILKFFYFDKLSMKEIQTKLNLASVQVAKNKKMKCLKKLRTLVSEDTEYVDLLKHR